MIPGVLADKFVASFSHLGTGFTKQADSLFVINQDLELRTLRDMVLVSLYREALGI